jgi:hypothetical protein
MKKILYGLLLCVSTLLSWSVAQTSATNPSSANAIVSSTRVRVGPYPMIVDYMGEAKGGQALEFVLRSETYPLEGAELEVTAIPGTKVAAVPVKAKLTSDPTNARQYFGSVNLPVSGLWILDVYIKGAEGEGAATAPILAGAPPALPLWLGWLIGLIPAASTLAFIIVRALPIRHEATLRSAAQ